MKTGPPDNEATAAFDALERGVHAALETYSNVHRGSGHNSVVSTHLFEQARDIVLEHLGLSSRQARRHLRHAEKRGHADGTTRARKLSNRFKPRRRPATGRPGTGRRAKGAAARAFRSSPGEGRRGSYLADWVIWAAAPDRFEAGTPAIVNVIAFAKALRLTRQPRRSTPSRDPTAETLTAAEILRHDELDQYTGRAAAARTPADPDRPRCARSYGRRRPTLRQPGQRRQHAHVRADMDRRPPDVAPAQARPAGDRSGGQVRRRRCPGRALVGVRRDLHVQHDRGHQPGGRKLEPGSRARAPSRSWSTRSSSTTPTSCRGARFRARR